MSNDLILELLRDAAERLADYESQVGDPKSPTRSRIEEYLSTEEPEPLRFEDKHYPDGPQTLGKDLCPEDQTEALRSFVYRFTGEHRPNWAKGTKYAVQFKDDSDWLAHTRFFTKKNGRLDKRCQTCESTPTWPFGKEAK